MSRARVTFEANTIEELYQKHLNNFSDMQQHMGILRYFASKCGKVLELGMRHGVSTTAFLAGGARVISVDIEPDEAAVKQLAWLCPQQFLFIRASSLDVGNQDTDMIFFDTVHTHEHLRKEIAYHESHAKRFMIFHDTQTFRLSGEDGKAPGLLAAIDTLDMKWKTLLDLDNCCGLMVLERR